MKLGRYVARAILFVMVSVMAVMFGLLMLIVAPIIWLGHQVLKDEGEAR